MQRRGIQITESLLVIWRELGGGGSDRLLQSRGSLAGRRGQRNTQLRSRLIAQQSEQPRDSRRLARAWTTRENAHSAQCADGSCQLLAVRLVGAQPIVVEQPEQGRSQSELVDL